MTDQGNSDRLDWRVAKPGKRDGDYYTETTGYDGNTSATHWPGRGISGVMIGVIQINTYEGSIPMAPGNMGNGTTFDFPLLWRPMEYADIGEVQARKPVEAFTEKVVEAAKWLELQGVRAITTNCGFFATYQKVVQEHIDTPFFSSSLMQLPVMLASLPDNKKVGIVTANGPGLLECSAIENCGVSLEDKENRLVVAGIEDEPEFQKFYKLTGEYNLAKMEQAIVNAARRTIEMDPDVGVILLECTELPPNAHAVQDAVRLPVWDFTTLVNFAYAGCLRRPFTGAI